MKYCCKDFARLTNRHPDTLYKYQSCWFIDVDIKKPQDFDSWAIDYCPFCGKKLKSSQVKNFQEGDIKYGRKHM